MRLLAAVVGAGLLFQPGLLAAVEPASEPESASALAGNWTLNKDQSEDARAKMREAGGRRGGGGGRGGFGGGRGGRWGGGQGRPGGGMPPDGERSGMIRSFFEPPETLDIARNGDEIAVNDGERIVILRPDGRRTKTDDGRTELTAKWRGDELVVESKTERAKVTTAYKAVPEKHQLHVTSRFEGRFGEPVAVRRVYDHAEPE